MRAALAAIVAALVAAPYASAADKYPTKPMRLVAPFPPGGGTDILGRLIVGPVSERLGQTVVVDNRPGAGGALGADIVAHSAPDGYTLIIVSSSYSAASAFGKPSYDPIDGIEPVILIGTTGIVLSVHPSVPVKSVAEFLAHVKANPGKLNYASVGVGSVTHLLFELFKLETNTNFVHVAYKGGGPALAATVGGEVQVTAISAVPSMPHIRAGRLRPLGVTTLKRMSILPNVPPIADTVPGFEVVHWYAMWAPKGTPQAIVKLWNAEVARVLKSPQMSRQMSSEGLTSAGGPPQEFYDVNKSAIQKWRRVIKEAELGTAK